MTWIIRSEASYEKKYKTQSLTNQTFKGEIEKKKTITQKDLK